MDQIPASRPITADDRPDLRPEEGQYEHNYQTIDGDQGTYESVSHPSAQDTEQRPSRRKVGFRCALALGIFLSVLILGPVTFISYYFTAGNESATVPASVCDPEVWVASVNQGSGGRGVLKPQLSGPVTCRAGCEADADCVSYELSNSACHFITDSFLELRDEPGTTSYRRQRVCLWGSAICIFTHEGPYDLNDKTDPPLSREPNLESCLLRCLNAASVCKGLSYNTRTGTGDCEPRNVATDLESRTKLKDYVEYTMACTGVTTTTIPTVPTTMTTQPTITTTSPTTTTPLTTSTTTPPTTSTTTTATTTATTPTPTTPTRPTTPLTNTLSTTPCSLFERVDSIANGGRNIGKLDQLECRRSCEEDPLCLAAEWNTDNRECITHTNLERRKRNTCCVAWEKLCLPTGCQDTFMRYNGSRGSDGVPQAGVNSVAACQAACLATSLCTGFDYVRNEGSPCRIYTTSFGRVTDNEFSDGYVRMRCVATLVATTPPPTQTPLPASCLADLVLVLDTSGSINENQGDNWNSVKVAINSLMDSFPIGQDRVRVGIVIYSNNAKTIQFLNETTTLADLHSRVDGLEYRGGKTNTPRGLQVAVNEVLQDGAGYRDHVKDVILLLTDGKTSPEYASDLPAAIRALRNRPNLQVFGLGVGDSVELSDLQDIASDPDTRYVHTFATFANLVAELRLAVSGVCSGVTTVSPTTNQLLQG